MTHARRSRRAPGGPRPSLRHENAFLDLTDAEVANAFAAYDTHLGDWCASIEAINSGGSAVTLSGFGYQFPDGANLVSRAPEPGSTPLPHRLEPHTSATFMMGAEDILGECARRGIHPSDLKSWVQLQTGKTIFGAAPPIEPG
jgi:hypothetical protein